MRKWIFGLIITLTVFGMVGGTPVAQSPTEKSGSVLERSKRLLEEGDVSQAKKLFAEAIDIPSDHFPAYGFLVKLAIEAQDQAELSKLFAMHHAYPFEDPRLFRSRIQYYELRVLRRAYNQAIQAAMGRRWSEAEHGFSLLLGDGAFHQQALGWLFHLAMQQHDYSKARFLAELGRDPVADPALSTDLLAACVLQREGERQPALGYLIRELARRDGYTGSKIVRLEAQRAIFVAMIRLHNELDQCFLHGMRNAAEGRMLFPELPDEVVTYLARP